MCNANDSMVSKVQELMELRKMAEDLQAEMDAITDEIKAYMGSEETMMAGSWKVTWKETVSRRMDTKKMWFYRPDVAQEPHFCYNSIYKTKLWICKFWQANRRTEPCAK